MSSVGRGMPGTQDRLHEMEDSRARLRRHGTFTHRPQMALTQSEELSVSRFAPHPKKIFNTGKVIYLYSIRKGLQIKLGTSLASCEAMWLSGEQGKWLKECR